MIHSFLVKTTGQASGTSIQEIEKIAYAVLISSRKLKHNFQAHKIIVPSLQPLGIYSATKKPLEE